MGLRTRKFYKSLQTNFSFEWILFALVFFSVNYIITNELNFVPISLDESKYIQKEGKLLNTNGTIIEYGISNQPLKELIEEDLRTFLGLKTLNFLRYKKWDQFEAVNQDAYILVDIIDLGYLTYVQVLVKFFEKQQDEIQSLQITFESLSITGSLKFSKKMNEQQQVAIKPLTKQKNNFFYLIKSLCMEVKGQLQIENQHNILLNFNNTNQSIGGRNIIRGIFNYETNWSIATAKGKIQQKDEKLINFAISIGSSDSRDSLKLQNVVYLDGEIEAINSIKSGIQQFNDMSIPWILATDNLAIPGSFKVEFHPLYTNQIYDDLYIIKINVKQHLGYFSGFYITKKGDIITFDKLYGVYEINNSRW
ncbi:transmembrane protein, putative (macronuclear) [Tetrahymena thermophila SB210]|uniref:Transmembrane protein, putative n=1 Tax=Tetrahymena thermophila (strain SB210) TaxID=312017 RepID=I7M794_TETTS|nr:transmembrane protein, putative [Tetrahymena thermophila SB210]EAR90802.2 transmembrane protein, putative [Tetrahymena thermophila SB210]|eukprot:XP_001011047.2 transmembrane protein, putative [Tetrahymena thermophila SB210]